MNLEISKEVRDFIFIHLCFVVICILIIFIPVPNYMGIKLFILVVIYNVLLPVFSYLRKYSEWITIWLFVFFISLFQIWPDWFLSAEFNILVFPEDGFIKIGTVSLYMAGLWTIPLFLIIFIGLKIREHYSKSITYIIVGVLSLLIFGIAEETIWMLESWYAQNVTMIGHLAVYIIFPEILLGLSTYYGYVLIQKKSLMLKIPVAFIIMLLYLGSSVFCYFLIERIFIL